MDFILTDHEKKLLLTVARDAIAASLDNRAFPLPEPTPTLQENCGAFVSLHKKGELRGCIGYITGIEPLLQTVKDMAVSAAFQDPRFPPVRKPELPEVEIEISVLSPLKLIRSFDEIEVGKHGLYIKRGLYSGLLLPQVAVQYKWDRDEFLKYTCQKAGLPMDSWKKNDTEIYIFSAIIFSEKAPKEEPIS